MIAPFHFMMVTPSWGKQNKMSLFGFICSVPFVKGGHSHEQRNCVPALLLLVQQWFNLLLGIIIIVASSNQHPAIIFNVTSRQ